jgi:hypothetical protein
MPTDEASYQSSLSEAKWAKMKRRMGRKRSMKEKKRNVRKGVEEILSQALESRRGR